MPTVANILTALPLGGNISPARRQRSISGSLTTGARNAAPLTAMAFAK